MSDIRASEIQVGQTIHEYGAFYNIVVTELDEFGDTMLVTAGDERLTFDRDEVVELVES